MARVTKRLTALAVSRQSSAGMHADGNGLYLHVKDSGAKSWALIFKLDGKRREMGLGPYPAISLALAREQAAVANTQVASGIDPIAARKKSAASTVVVTFGDAATNLIAALKVGWKNPKHHQQWTNTLTTHAASLWNLPIDQIAAQHVLDVLSPIWAEIPETASRVRGRIERVLDAAKARGLRMGENPARWNGHLSILLPARTKKSHRGHHPAMPFGEVAAFMQRLSAQEGSAPKALRFTILTAARTSEALNAVWAEFDLKAARWTIPAARMKSGINHVVPLSGAALVVLRAQHVLPRGTGDFVFPGAKEGRPLSNMSMEMVLRRMKKQSVTVHGFRSSFRDWAGELTDHARETAEAALAHAVGNEVEVAYRRGTSIDKRVTLMQDWADYLAVDV